MKRSAGIALITVLLVMLAIMVLGIGTLFLTNSNLMISSNLVSHSVARTNSEGGLDAALTALRDQVRADGHVPDSFEAPAVSLAGGSLEYRLVEQPRWVDNVAVLRIEGLGPRNARFESVAVVEFVPGSQGGGVRPFSGLVQACEAVTVHGSGRIDSFDSRLGSYSAGTARRNAHVQLLGPDGHVEITGSGDIWGDVYSTGSITSRGSGTVLGDVYASGQVTVQAASHYSGSISTTGGITFNNSATVAGDVAANGDIRFDNAARVRGSATSGGNIIFSNSSARIDGDALAAGTISFTHNNRNVRHVAGRSDEGGNPTPVRPVPPVDCDPLDVTAEFAQLSSLPGGSTVMRAARPRRDLELTPDGARHFDLTWNVNDWVPAPEFPAQSAAVFGSEATVYRVPEVNIGSDSRLFIRGGDVVIVTDGDFRMNNNSRLIIDPDSSLTVVAGGRTVLSNSFRTDPMTTLNDNGVPSLSIYSAYSSASGGVAGVEVSGSVSFGATVYAPHTSVHLAASGDLYGSVLGREVRVTGSGGVHYDEALAEVELGTGGDGEETAADLRLLSRR